MKFKRLIPAFCMLLVAAIVLSTSTFAWFSMSGTVTANNMEIKARSEGGIVITNESGTDWQTVKPASHSGSSLEVVPTSTADTEDWFHNKSSQFDDAEPNQTSGYEKVSAIDTTGAKFQIVDGIGYVDDTDTTTTGHTAGYDAANETAYFLKNTFYIKSTEATDIVDNTNSVLYIRKIKVTDADSSVTSADLDKALRIAIVITDTNTDNSGSPLPSFTKIYAPFNTTTLSYTVDRPTTNASVTAISAYDASGTATVNTAVPVANLQMIPKNTATIAGGTGIPKAVKVDVYLYFEGEDVNCKSSFLTATLDAIDVEIEFGTSAA